MMIFFSHVTREKIQHKHKFSQSSSGTEIDFIICGVVDGFSRPEKLNLLSLSFGIQHCKSYFWAAMINPWRAQKMIHVDKKKHQMKIEPKNPTNFEFKNWNPCVFVIFFGNYGGTCAHCRPLGECGCGGGCWEVLKTQQNNASPLEWNLLFCVLQLSTLFEIYPNANRC